MKLLLKSHTAGHSIMYVTTHCTVCKRPSVTLEYIYSLTSVFKNVHDSFLNARQLQINANHERLHGVIIFILNNLSPKRVKQEW